MSNKSETKIAPNNMKAFDLELAKAGHKLSTRDGREAKFIAHVPDSDHPSKKIVAQVKSSVFLFGENGQMWHEGIDDIDLFLAPLGFCEGKPVFAGDKLVGPCGDIFAEPYMTERGAFDLAKWPSQKPIVETRMTAQAIKN